jgi:hypothetical protein
MFTVTIIDKTFDALADIYGHCTVHCDTWGKAVEEALDNLLDAGVEATITEEMPGQ